MKVGVIIGRFQAPILHSGYKHLFKEVAKRCDAMIILIGDNDDPPSLKNPFNFECREELIRLYFESWTIEVEHLAIKRLVDMPSDIDWSAAVDYSIEQLLFDLNIELKEDVSFEVTLYGSRDSFNKYYTGVFSFKEIEGIPKKSSTRVREIVIEKYTPTNISDFMAGQLIMLNELSKNK